MLKFSIILILTLGSACGADDRKSTYVPSSTDESVARNPQKSGELALFHRLTSNYEPAVRPVRNHSKAVVVKLGLSLIKIVDVDMKHQTISVNCWLDQEWHDDFYVWDPVEFQGISSIRLPNKYIWKPDIELYNKADNLQSGKSESLAMIYHDGTIFLASAIRLSSTCKMDLTYFPFDSQKCFLKFGSWAYHGFQVDVTNRSSNVDLSNYVVNDEFVLFNVAQKRRVVKYTCCPEPYPDVTFFLHLQRRSLPYIWTILVPAWLVSGLSLLTFCLPFESGRRATFGILAFLCYLLLFVSIQGKLHEYSGSVPLIGIYFLVVMGLMAISLLLTVVVPNVDRLVQLATQMGQSNRIQDSSPQSKNVTSSDGSAKKPLYPEFQNNQDKTGTQMKEETTEGRKEQIASKSKNIINILNAGLFLVMLLLTIVVPLVLVPLVQYNRKAKEDNWTEQLLL